MIKKINKILKKSYKLLCLSAFYIIEKLKYEVDRIIITNLKQIIVDHSIKHLSGPKKIKYGPNELIIICLVKNGAQYVKNFIEYHFSLGIKHIILIDSSEDETCQISNKYSNVTIFKHNLPFKKYERELRRYGMKRFCKKRWCLWVDVDELFDYPFSNKIDLKSLLKYLNDKKHTAVITQMLDMFGNKPLSKMKVDRKEPITKKYKYYDIDEIKKTEYFRYCWSWIFGNKNKLNNRKIKFYSNGIRKKIFDAPCWLTKHSLFFVDNKIESFINLHYVNNANVADFSAVLYHYKLMNDFEKKVKEVIKERGYPNQCFYEWLKYNSVLKKEKSISIKKKSAKKLNGVNDLIKNDFLVISKDYLDWINKNK